jgi:hypothetical protein
MDPAPADVHIAILIDEKMQQFADDPRNDAAVLDAISPYMAGFKELMDTAKPDELFTILQRYPGLCQFVRVLERVAAQID